MAMARWQPFQDMFTLRNAMDQLFEQSFVPTSRLARTAAAPMDVYAEGDTYVIEAAIPGLAPEAINVAVLGNQVTISGEYPAAPEGRQYVFRERAAGRFERTIYLPTELDADKAEAHYEHGMLRLTIPQHEAAKPKRIALNAGK